MRLFFHLVSEFSEIPNVDGLEIEEIDDLRLQILTAVAEISEENPCLLKEGTGWRIDVADSSRRILHSFALDEIGIGSPLDNLDREQTRSRTWASGQVFS